MNAVYDPPAAVAEWLARRRTGMFSSDAAAACGVSPWGTPLEVWLSKVEPLADRRPTEAMVAGLALEPAVARLYELRFPGVELASPALVMHPDRPWMGASVDRIGDHGRIVELKTASAYAADLWGEDGTDDVPEQYLVQVTHQMEVLRVDEADVAVLIGGQDFRVFPLRRNADLAARIVEVEEELWERVRTRRPPAPDWEHPGTPALMARLALRCDPDAETALSEDLVHWADRYAELGQWVAAAKEERDGCKARLIHALGECGRGVLPDGRVVTAARVDRRAYEVEATSYVQFNLRAPRARKGGGR